MVQRNHERQTSIGGKSKHIILVSHGQFASGLKSAIGVVMGMADEITALGLEEGMDIKTFREKFLEILNQIPKEDEIILLCDIIEALHLQVPQNY